MDRHRLSDLKKGLIWARSYRKNTCGVYFPLSQACSVDSSSPEAVPMLGELHSGHRGLGTQDFKKNNFPSGQEEPEKEVPVVQSMRAGFL